MATRLSLLALFLTIAGSGCVSSAMHKLGKDYTLPPPQPDKATIVFMRPSTLGYAIQSSVFDLRPDGDRFVGIVSSTTKIVYVADPGQHLFMVIGENADFMRANLDAGKTYHALVTPRMGWWKARFSFQPVHKADFESGDFAEWDSATEYIENTEQSRQWAKENWESVEDKKTDYMRKWNEKTEDELNELTLNADDGR